MSKVFAWVVASVAAIVSGCDDEAAVSLCPSGTAEFQRSDEAGSETWCKRADGTAHGPYALRNAEDALLVSGAFAEGLADGPWQRFSPQRLFLYADEGYHQGLPHGRWTLYSAEGEPRSEHAWAYGEPCGTWRELSGTLEYGTQVFRDCDAVEAPPEPEPGQTRAVVGDFGWDGMACADGELVSNPPDDPTARFCVDANGVKDGDFGRWYVDGAKALGGSFSVGVASGTWRTWYPGGTVHEEGPMQGERRGKWRSWRSDRSLESEGEWADGAREGAWNEFWPHGTRRAEGVYRNDLREGLWQEFWPTGIPKQTDTWRAGLREGPHTTFHDSGLPEIEGSYVNDLRHGPWKTWHDNGMEATAGRYEAGMAEGVWKTWDRAGLPSGEGPFVGGVIHGTWTYWYLQVGERIKSTGEVEHGVLQGPWRSVHDPGGELAAEVVFINGGREGPSRTVWKSGNTQSEGSYLADDLHGPWLFNYPSGQLFFSCTFASGEYHGHYVEYWENGQVKAEGDYLGGYKTGLWDYWDEDGRTIPDPSGGM